MHADCELRLTFVAEPIAVRPMRHGLRGFLEAIEIEDELRDDVLTAVGETLANAVEHAYDAQVPGSVEMHARTTGEQTLLIDIVDRGTFIERELRAGRGLGLRIVRAIARSISIDTNGGTRISMVFDAGAPVA